MHKSSITNAITFSRQLDFCVCLESCCLVIRKPVSLNVKMNIFSGIPMFASNFNYKLPSWYISPLCVFLVVYRKKEWLKSTSSLDAWSTNIHPKRIRELSNIFNLKIVESSANEKMQKAPQQLSTLTSYIGNQNA